MNLLSLIARRHIASSHNLSFLSFVSYLSIAGLTIGITVLILTLGILKGFEKEVQEKIIGFDGHIRIRGFLGNPLSDYQPQLDSILASIPEVSGRLPYIHHAATVRLFGKTEAVFVEAFDPSIAENVLQTSKSLIDGNFNLIDTYENTKTPTCFPINRPNSIPKGTGIKIVLKVIPSRFTPAFAKAKIGIIPKATYGDKRCSNFKSNE